MQRKEAEKLLAALIFDDLDEASKTELLNYLQTDNELRERLADMRMAVKVASDTVQHGPDPVLGKRRLKRLARLARHQRTWTAIFTVPRLAAAAAIFIISALALISIKSTDKARVAWSDAATKYELPSKIETGFAYDLSHSESSTGAPSRGDKATEITSTRRQFAFHPAARGPDVVDSITGMNDNALIQKQTLEDMMNYRRQIEVERKNSKEGKDVLRKTAEASIPYAGNLTYPDDWKKIIASPYRKPEEPLGQGQYAYDPAVRGPDVVDGITFIGGETDFIKNKIGRITNAQPYSLHGYADSSPKTGPTDKWDSGSIVAESSFEGKPHSGVTIGGGDGSYDVGEYRPWWARDHGAGSGDKNGEGIDTSYYYPGGGFGGMGGYGGMGVSGGGGYGGSMGMMGGYGGYGGGTYGDYSHVWRGFDMGKDDSYDGAFFSSRSEDSGNGVDAGSGFISGDRLGVGARTHDADIYFGSKGTSLLTKPDASGIVADGIPATGRVEFQNGHAPGTTTDGSTVNIIDSFDVVGSNEGAPRPVTVDVGKPVTITEPELTPPLSLGPMKDVSGKTNLPDIKLQTESAESHVSVEDTEYRPWWAEMRNYDNEAVFKKADDELGTKSHRLAPEKVEPPVPEYVGVVDGGREGDVSRETDEAEIPYSAVISSADSERYIADFLRSSDKTKSLLKKAESAGRDSSAPAEGSADKKESGGVPIVPKIPMVGHLYSDRDLQGQGGLADKEESGRVPILGDIPIIGGLYGSYDMKKPLTDEEKRRIVAHLKDRKSQPEGESEITAIFPQSELVVKYRIDEQSAVDLASTLTGEDEPDLPPASRFKIVPVNPWVMSERDPLSTFALDVDTASYTLCRRYIRGGFLPPAGAVRMEEFVNYFNYQYPQRTNPTFKVHAEAAPSPFARTDQNLTLLKIGVKARTIGRDQRKAAHLIFVVDASASMGQPDRLPLVQQALGLLVNKLSAVDRVSLITCANEARLHLETIPARERDRIRQAINAIQPAGSTNLLAGLKLGYATARRSFAPKQINHVVLCSDGVANVGQTEAEVVLEEVAEDRKQGITITCVGVGYGSYNDAFMEALANRGDGSYMFLDSARQAHRVFVRQLAATLQTVARDARIQVDFNPNRVRRYRLIGYENRDIEDKRFRDDTIDAGEVGSGQCSTALYELELIGQPSADRQDDLGTVFVRYRNVETGQIEEISSRLDSAIVRRRTVESAPRFFLAAGAARFAEILRQSEHAQNGNLKDVLRVVEQVSLALPLDRDVRELTELIRKAENLPRSP